MENLKFEKFSSIENSYREKYINYIYEQGLNDGEWIVTEKIDGSNISYWVSNLGVKIARRTDFLEEGENFNNAHSVLEKHKEGFLSLYKELNDKYGIDAIAVYGEIYGGVYPHPEVEKIKGAKKIQGRIKYRPDNDIAAFSIKVIHSEDGINKSKHLDRDEIVELFIKHKIPYVKELFRGTLEECLKMSHLFQTTIPKELGLPEIEGNFAEGKVIQPVTEKRFRTGERIIIKDKNPKFAEKEDNKKIKAPPVELPEQVKKALVEASVYINENRLRNVLSKFGEVNEKDFGKIMGLMIKDVVEDYMKESDTLDSLEKEDRKSFNKALGKDIGNMIRPNFLNIIDGMY